MKNYYQILDLEFGADIKSVKKAYRNLALKYHPDRNKDFDATQKFIEITEAYEVLKNFEKKKQYDEIYRVYFDKNNMESFNDNLNIYQQEEWANYGRQKAEEYSAIPFEEFARYLLKEISIGVNYIPNIIAMLFVGGSALGSLTILPKAFDDNSGFGLFILTIVLGLGYLTYRLFLVAQADYKEDRKRKSLSK